MKPFIRYLILVCIGSPLGTADLRLRGSDLLGAKLVPQLTQVYRKLHPSVSFDLEAEGSASCFSSLLAGNCDIGMSSRPVFQQELKRFEVAQMSLKEHGVAHDMVAVIVNEEAHIKSLSLKQVEQIFTGEIRNWDHFGGKGEIVTFSRNTSSGTYKSFQKLAMNQREYGVKNSKFSGSNGLAYEISQNANAIGYSGVEYAKNMPVRAVKINGIAPVASLAHDYPLSRHLLFYTVGDSNPEVEQFIKWVQGSTEAHKIIARVGFIIFQPKAQKAEQAVPPKSDRAGG